MRYLIIGLSIIAALSCLSLAVQAQPPGYRVECSGSSCRLVPAGPTVTSSTTITTPIPASTFVPERDLYTGPSGTTYYRFGGYGWPTPANGRSWEQVHSEAVGRNCQTTTTYVSPPIYVQPMYATPPRQSYVQTYRGPFGGTWTRAYSATGAGVVSSGFYGGSSCGNPYCGCGNCRCVNCVCGY